MRDEFSRYRPWFYAAAAYNLLWGAVVVLFPAPLLAIAGIQETRAAPLAQPLLPSCARTRPLRRFDLDCARRQDLRAARLRYSFAAGVLPWNFTWVCVFNDVIWWPAFWSFALKHARRPLSVVRSPLSEVKGRRSRSAQL